jgi:glycosyltransferase involved in cell wall biosynthesis
MSGRWLVLGSHIPAAGRLGGMIRYTVEVLRALEDRADVEVHVHCRSDTVPFLETELGIDGARLHAGATGSTIRDSIIERHGLGELIDRLRPDAVLGTKQLLPRRAGDATRILTVHDMLPFDRPGDFGPAKRMLLPRAYRRSITDADILACVSEATLGRLVHHVASARERAVVIPNAMSSSLTSTPAEPIRALGGRNFALVVGDRSHRKNLGFVVDLWPEVVARHPGAHLALAGPPGWGRNEQLPGLTDLTGAGVASELGMITDGELRWAYEQAAVTLCPSRLEGFGLPVLEALSLGCPVVLSTDPAQVEVAGDRATSIDLGRPGDWVQAIIDRLNRPRLRLEAPPGRGWVDVAADLVAAAEAGPHRAPGPLVAGRR